MSIMDRHRGPKAYHTPQGEVARLLAIMHEYRDDPECVSRAQATLDAFRAAHPEITAAFIGKPE